MVLVLLPVGCGYFSAGFRQITAGISITLQYKKFPVYNTTQSHSGYKQKILGGNAERNILNYSLTAFRNPSTWRKYWHVAYPGLDFKRRVTPGTISKLVPGRIQLTN